MPVTMSERASLTCLFVVGVLLVGSVGVALATSSSGGSRGVAWHGGEEVENCGEEQEEERGHVAVETGAQLHL